MSKRKTLLEKEELFKKISKIIKIRRLIRELTMEDVSKEIGIGTGNYSKKEKNPEKFRLEELVKLQSIIEFDFISKEKIEEEIQKEGSNARC